MRSANSQTLLASVGFDAQALIVHVREVGEIASGAQAGEVPLLGFPWERKNLRHGAAEQRLPELRAERVMCDYHEAVRHHGCGHCVTGFAPPWASMLRSTEVNHGDLHEGRSLATRWNRDGCGLLEIACCGFLLPQHRCTVGKDHGGSGKQYFFMTGWHARLLFSCCWSRHHGWGKKFSSTNGALANLLDVILMIRNPFVKHGCMKLTCVSLSINVDILSFCAQREAAQNL